MKIRISIFLITITSIFFYSCKEGIKEPKLEYNNKANELIEQLISEENCNCVLEIPKENIVEIEMLENSTLNIEKDYIKKLSLKDKNELDSLIKISEGFELDKNYVTTKKIKLIKRDSSFRTLSKDIIFNTKTCRKGVLYFVKPIFNKKFNLAIIKYGKSGICCDLGRNFFEYKNHKWERK
ncbi:hypothetical protein C8C83_3181 [Flavobacterium sp. 90]|uniref:hypothetical protein n=1 Tax=unclassified Flavobacterium TaxID=196869 RepID=UPI000EAE7E62|nr:MULTISPECIES: hypothetical protein [unclassified Flavobacterium]RKR11448.1 hypothetical protein C8C82_3491 [Flavobacterium sp. 81]TCK55229.1 hypothetical protein C8C83_3181 [Flavobacterium sp. 90]